MYRIQFIVSFIYLRDGNVNNGEGWLDTSGEVLVLLQNIDIFIQAYILMGQNCSANSVIQT